MVFFSPVNQPINQRSCASCVREQPITSGDSGESSGTDFLQVFCVYAGSWFIHKNILRIYKLIFEQAKLLFFVAAFVHKF